MGTEMSGDEFVDLCVSVIDGKLSVLEARAAAGVGREHVIEALKAVSAYEDLETAQWLISRFNLFPEEIREGFFKLWNLEKSRQLLGWPNFPTLPQKSSARKIT